MAEPTIKDVLEALKSITTEMTTLKAEMASLKDKSPSSSAASEGGRHEGPRDSDRPPRFQKLDFPRYDGKTDPMLFINKCESYFRQQRTMAEERVWMASYNLEDVAQLWYIQLQEDEGTPPWGRFKELLNLRFGPPLRSAPLFELAECRRTGSVEEYSNRFQALLPRAGRLDESQRVQLYTGGLLPPMSYAVRIHHPETLAGAMSLARQVEMMGLGQPAPPPARGGPRGLLPTPGAQHPRPPQAVQPVGAAPPRLEGQPVKRLSLEE
ncbi:hypothetical protein GUJ93_ZPchr0010g9973 [Zizania palustris]|uniref:Retrotransposon gag domain-containing protein n=1 Tax=Zizania palustris TaxID=103762 RepID=A0A8J5SZ42_ZIZPA|nr:hypothetical protein GUJ93_ZPchr0010g9973 [Zizania palustris]